VSSDSRYDSARYLDHRWEQLTSEHDQSARRDALYRALVARNYAEACRVLGVAPRDPSGPQVPLRIDDPTADQPTTLDHAFDRHRRRLLTILEDAIEIREDTLALPSTVVERWGRAVEGLNFFQPSTGLPILAKLTAERAQLRDDNVRCRYSPDPGFESTMLDIARELAALTAILREVDHRLRHLYSEFLRGRTGR
jgi:hypothetical protein